MYTASTFQMAKAMHLDFLLAVPRFFIYIALIAWFAAFIGFCRHIVTAVRGIIATRRTAS
jgi:hypothetical protein